MTYMQVVKSNATRGAHKIENTDTPYLHKKSAASADCGLELVRFVGKGAQRGGLLLVVVDDGAWHETHDFGVEAERYVAGRTVTIFCQQ